MDNQTVFILAISKSCKYSCMANITSVATVNMETVSQLAVTQLHKVYLISFVITSR